ncbi:MAG: SpoIIIAH-like family protein [Bacillota bacterium]
MKAEKSMRIVTMKMQTVIIALLLIGAGILYFSFQGTKTGGAPPPGADVVQGDGTDTLVGPVNPGFGEDNALNAIGSGSNTVQAEQTGDEYFIQFRLDRDRVRSQEIDMLKETVNNPNSSPESRQEAQKRLLQMTNIMEQELQLESLIKAKGFRNAAIFVQQGGATVIIQATNLNQEDASKVADLVARTTGHSLEDIVVIPKG